jgi:hypothetical protein
MVRKIAPDLVIIGEPQEDKPCAFCGKVDELRPYGPNDEWICFDCAMKDEATAAKKFRAIIEGPSEN